MFKRGLLLWILLFGLAGCGLPSTPTVQVSYARCIPATTAQLEVIRAGVKGEQASNDIKTGFAVKSKDFANVYMVAAKIYGPSIENGVGPGVWAISGDPNKPGLTLSVDGWAQQFSDYPDASKTKAAITESADGVQEAISCAKR